MVGCLETMPAVWPHCKKGTRTSLFFCSTMVLSCYKPIPEGDFLPSHKDSFPNNIATVPTPDLVTAYCKENFLLLAILCAFSRRRDINAFLHIKTTICEEDRHVFVTSHSGGKRFDMTALCKNYLERWEFPLFMWKPNCRELIVSKEMWSQRNQLTPRSIWC